MPFRGRIIQLTIVLIGLISLAGVYIGYFRHPPPDVLIQMNQRSFKGAKLGQRSDFGESMFRPEFFKSHNGKQSDIIHGTTYWDNFLRKNKYVPIGAVYDKCEGERSQIGTVILLEDKELGGVSAWTFFNITFEEEIEDGTFSIDVKYNGQDLYDNYWSLCELEEELPPANRTFNCPISATHWTVQKPKHIPGYLPKGTFTSKAWATDDDDNVLGCGYSQFTL